MSALFPAASASIFEPHALRAHRLFQTPDLDEARWRISGVMQPHDLRSLDRHTARPAHMDFARVGAIGLGAIDFGGAARVDVGAVDDYHLLIFCLRGQAQARVGDRRLSSSTRQGLICAPGHPFIADFSTDCEQFVMRLDWRSVEAHAGMPVHFDSQLDLRRPELRAWLDLLRALTASESLLHAARQQPLVAIELERLLIHLLAPQHGMRLAAESGKSLPLASRVVRRAENFMESHATEALRLADIARAADVPVRTLLDAFKRFRDYSPMQHLRQLRLNRVRAVLMAPPHGATVSGVALEHGFVHLGRFAQAYHQRYGEAPSATLARHAEVRPRH